MVYRRTSITILKLMIFITNTSFAGYFMHIPVIVEGNIEAELEGAISWATSPPEREARGDTSRSPSERACHHWRSASLFRTRREWQ